MGFHGFYWKSCFGFVFLFLFLFFLSDETVCNFSCMVKVASCFSDSAEEFLSAQSKEDSFSCVVFHRSLLFLQFCFKSRTLDTRKEITGFGYSLVFPNYLLVTVGL